MNQYDYPTKHVLRQNKLYNNELSKNLEKLKIILPINDLGSSWTTTCFWDYG